MNYEMKRVVITGGSGPVGLALIRKLLKENKEVLLLQRETSDRAKYLPDDERICVQYCSLENLKYYRPEKLDKKYDVFFHLGWTNTKRDGRNDFQKQKDNISYSLEAVRVAQELGCHTFIGAGSQAEYGRCSEILTDETVCKPETAYGIIKHAACYATRSLCDKYGIRHIWPRILSAYGIYDNENSMLISNILRALKNQTLEFTKGEQIWDFIYLDDVANALYLMALYGVNHAIYPVASGAARPLKEYIDILCKKLKVMDSSKIKIIPYGQGQVMHLEADISKLKKDTGWLPKVSFEDGIEQVIQFYRKRIE